MTEERHISRHEQQIAKGKDIENQLTAAWGTESIEDEYRHNAGYDHHGLAECRTLGEKPYVEQCNERIGEQKGLRYADGDDYHTVEQVAGKRIARRRLTDKSHRINDERSAHHFSGKDIILESFPVGNGKEEKAYSECEHHSGNDVLRQKVIE